MCCKRALNLEGRARRPLQQYGLASALSRSAEAQHVAVKRGSGQLGTSRSPRARQVIRKRLTRLMRSDLSGPALRFERRRAVDWVCLIHRSARAQMAALSAPPRPWPATRGLRGWQGAAGGFRTVFSTKKWLCRLRKGCPRRELARCCSRPLGGRLCHCEYLHGCGRLDDFGILFVVGRYGTHTPVMVCAIALCAPRTPSGRKRGRFGRVSTGGVFAV